MKFGIGAIALVVMCAAVAAQADEALQTSGFATASLAGNVDRRASQFSLEQAEIDVRRELSPRGTVRVDLEWTWDGRAWTAAVEQGWLAYRPAAAPALVLTAGRFNAPIGFESIDAPDLWQATHGLLFTYGAPSNLTGGMAAVSAAHGLDLKLYAANDWDTNSETNASPTFGGRLGWTHGGLACGASAITGLADSAQAVRRTVFDVDVTWTVGPKLLLGGEFNAGQVDAGGADGSWTGFMVMAHAQPNETVGFTARYDQLDDTDDLVFATGASERRSSVTGAGLLTLGPGMRLVGEVRADLSDVDAFTDHAGAPKSSTLGGTLALTYAF